MPSHLLCGGQLISLKQTPPAPSTSEVQASGIKDFLMLSCLDIATVMFSVSSREQDLFISCRFSEGTICQKDLQLEILLMCSASLESTNSVGPTRLDG